MKKFAYIINLFVIILLFGCTNPMTDNPTDQSNYTIELIPVAVTGVSLDVAASTREIGDTIQLFRLPS